MHEQQLDTMRKLNSKIDRFACGFFALLVSLTQYSTIDANKLCDVPPFASVAIVLQTEKTLIYLF